MLPPPNHIFDHTPDTLRDWCVARGMKPFRAEQILEWVYRKRISDPAAMSNLSNLDREVLVRVHEPISVIDMLDVQSSTHSWNFNDALATVARAECGVIVLLHRQESAQELLERAQLSPRTARSAPAVALRNYGVGAQILRDLKVKKMRLMAQPRRMPSMAGFGLEITGYLAPQDR